MSMGCANGNGGQGSGGTDRPKAGGSAATADPDPLPPPVAVTDDGVKYVEELWAKGSGFLADTDALIEVKEKAKVEVYGTVVRIRVNNVPGLANYQLYQYLIKVSRTSGQPRGAKFIPAPGADPAKSKARRTGPTKGWEPSPEHPDDGRIEDGVIGPGDYVSVNVRVISRDRPSVEQLIAKGETIWAAYESMPLTEHNPFISPMSCPLAWTTRHMAFLMAGAMGS
jgi:hypothetical protein